MSGFIILLDRSVSLGDLVTIDNHNGQLTKMTARYVVVRSLGGVESIIPNDTLITSTVVNHSYTDKRVRQAVVVQVHYASDLDLALRTLEEIAQRQRQLELAERVFGSGDGDIILRLRRKKQKQAVRRAAMIYLA